MKNWSAEKAAMLDWSRTKEKLQPTGYDLCAEWIPKYTEIIVGLVRLFFALLKTVN